MRNYWSLISNLGIEPKYPFGLAKRIRITNRLAFLVSAFTVTYFIIDILFFPERKDEIVLKWFYAYHLIATLVGPIVLWLNSLKQYTVARLTLLLTLFSLEIGVGMIIGQPYRTEFYFFGLAASTFVLFDNLKIIIPLFVFASFLFIVFVANVHQHIPTAFEFNSGLIIRIGISFIFLFTVLYLLQIESKQYDKKINKKNRLLEEERNEVYKANFTKGRILSVISHDLRGPINSLKGLLTLISNKQLSQEEFQYHSQKLNSQVSQLQITLEELLSWARASSNNMQIKPENIQIREIITSTIKSLKPLADEKGLEIQKNIQDDVTIYADRGMIRSVFTNLINNAIKFTASGSISISLLSSENRATILFKDSGIGIAEENLTKVFEGNFTTLGTNSEKGTGVGLSLSQEFVKINNGTIKVESHLNEGSTFTLTFEVSTQTS